MEMGLPPPPPKKKKKGERIATVEKARKLNEAKEAKYQIDASLPDMRCA